MGISWEGACAGLRGPHACLSFTVDLICAFTKSRTKPWTLPWLCHLQVTNFCLVPARPFREVIYTCCLHIHPVSTIFSKTPLT